MNISSIKPVLGTLFVLALFGAFLATIMAWDKRSWAIVFDYSLPAIVVAILCLFIAWIIPSSSASQRKF